MVVGNFLASWGYPKLDWIQVGVTTECNAACIYCPHPMFKKHGRSRHMSMQDFSALAPAFARSELVYLQGWGEPMLHPEFMSMIELVKKKGAQVGATSNGTMLTEDMVRKLVDLELDVLGLSVAGVDQVNDQIRPGSTLKQIQRAVEMVHRIRALKGSSVPSLHMAYMLLASRRCDIPRMPHFFNSLGLDHIVVSSLTLAISPEMEKEMYPAQDPQDFEGFKHELLDMQKDVDEGEDRVFFHIYNPYQEGGMCSENIFNACYADVDGRVLPCIYTDVAEGEQVYKYFQGEKHLLYPLEFGRLSSSNLKKIWFSRKYKEFREQFSRGNLHDVCKYCCKRYMDDLIDEQPQEILIDNSVPT